MSLFKKLLEAKIRKAGKRYKPRQLRIKWLYPHAQERNYATLLQRHIRALFKAYWAGMEGSTLLHKDGYTSLEQLFNDLMAVQNDLFQNGNFAGRILETGNKVASFNSKEFAKFTSAILGMEYQPIEVFTTALIKEWAEANQALVASLTSEAVSKLNSLTVNAVQQGLTHKELSKQVKKLEKNLTKARCNLIARDQIGKLNGNLARQRQQNNAGVNYYQWSTSGDERVRDSHKALDGMVCSWADPTIYSRPTAPLQWETRPANWVQVHPGEDIQCRCVGIPYFAELEQEILNDE
jgi:SPP1 gp7 family putative phage head morphogenesis protein